MDKASVSKDLNAKHGKILEGLLELPENRECADCRSNMLIQSPTLGKCEPGNLYLHALMQCSGIHRSLGVHISKVRSTTLDTWLPEQITFMESVGNEKTNNYWENNLPPNADRNRWKSFFVPRKFRYEGRKWVANNAIQPDPKLRHMGTTSNKLVEDGATSGRKVRRHSLEEAIFIKSLAKLAPPVARARPGSLDLNHLLTNSLLLEGTGHIPDCVKAKRKSNRAADRFNFLYDHDAKQECSTSSPADWATFDCKNNMSLTSLLSELVLGYNEVRQENNG